MKTGPTTNVSRSSNASERRTSAGNRKTAICATEFFTTETARSAFPFAASVIPTTFSTALPAIATITSPVNAFEIPSDSTAGSSACDEPVRDERRGDAARREHDEREPERQRRPRASPVCASSRGSSERR